MTSVVLLGIAPAACSRPASDCPATGEVAPADVIQRCHGLTADNRPTITLDSSKVPADLRDLIPLAQHWGIGDDVIRNDVIAKSTPEERQTLRQSLAPRGARITAWLDSFPPNGLSDEAAAFMYMQLALEELP